MDKRILYLLLAALVVFGPESTCGQQYLAQKDGPVCPSGQGGTEMKITSPEFKNNEFIPPEFTCTGKDVNPPLIIGDIPEGAKSLSLIVDDPDAPMGTWVHWVVFDIPVVNRIEKESVPGEQGVNTGGEKVYSGPCPPSGTHRYFFKLYALDRLLGLSGKVDKEALEEAMQGHILARAELVGLYKR